MPNLGQRLVQAQHRAHMMQRGRSLNQWLGLRYVALAAPMAFLIGACAYSGYCEIESIRSSILQKQIASLRSTAARHAGQLETILRLEGRSTEQQRPLDAAAVKSFWNSIELSPRHLYAALVDPMGQIVLHTNPAAVGEQLEPGWYDEAITDAGFDVVRVGDSPLSGRAPAYDVRVSLALDGRRVGEYHEGFDASGFEREVAARQREAWGKWAFVLALALAVDGAAIVALLQLGSQERGQRRTLGRLGREWAGRIAQIASGLTHEIRNPLQALRINLHTLRRSFSGRTKMEPEDLMDSINQSDRAIDSLETLMRDLVHFTSPAGGEKSEANLVSEARAALNLISPDMRRKQVEIRAHVCDVSALVPIDPAKLRQALLNLLTFSQNNAGAGGWVELDVSRNGSAAHICVADSGPCLSEPQETRIFEPFQAPKETGSGLGLALVKYFADEAGGSVAYVRGESGGCFRVVLPLISDAPKVIYR